MRESCKSSCTILQAIQVSINLTHPKVRNREIEGLIEAMQLYQLYSGGLNLGKEGCKIHPACKADDDVDSIESPEEDNAADGDEFCVKNFPNSNRLSINEGLIITENTQETFNISQYKIKILPT